MGYTVISRCKLTTLFLFSTLARLAESQHAVERKSLVKEPTYWGFSPKTTDIWKHISKMSTEIASECSFELIDFSEKSSLSSLLDQINLATDYEPFTCKVAVRPLIENTIWTEPDRLVNSGPVSNLRFIFKVLERMKRWLSYWTTCRCFCHHRSETALW